MMNARLSSSNSGLVAIPILTLLKTSTVKSMRPESHMPMRICFGYPWLENGPRPYLYYVWTSDSKETHPAGGQYQRPTNEGGGSTSTFPLNLVYRHLDNVGDGLEIEFVDPTMSGEYHIARSPDEKDALLTVPGAGLTLSEELGLSSKTDRVAFGGMGSTYVDPLFGQRSQDSEFERLRLYTDLQRPPSVTKMPGFDGTVDPVLVETEVLPVTMRTDYLRVGDDSVVTSFSLLLDHQDLALANKGGIYQGQVSINARITSVAGKRSGNFTDTINTDRFTDRDVAVGQQMKSIYQKNYILPPGRYKIDLFAQDTNTRKGGHHPSVIRRTAIQTERAGYQFSNCGQRYFQNDRRCGRPVCDRTLQGPSEYDPDL